MAQNEEHSALYEVEILRYIRYNNRVLESSSWGKNIFELTKNNHANMEVVKITKRILLCFSIYNVWIEDNKTQLRRIIDNFTGYV